MRFGRECNNKLFRLPGKQAPRYSSASVTTSSFDCQAYPLQALRARVCQHAALTARHTSYKRIERECDNKLLRLPGIQTTSDTSASVTTGASAARQPSYKRFERACDNKSASTAKHTSYKRFERECVNK